MCLSLKCHNAVLMFVLGLGTEKKKKKKTWLRLIQTQLETVQGFVQTPGFVATNMAAHSLTSYQKTTNWKFSQSLP